MRLRYYLTTRRIALVIFLLAGTGPLCAVTTVTESGKYVTVDLEDFLAGTLIGDDDLTNFDDPFAGDSPTTSHQVFENLGDPGSPVHTDTEIGFTIDFLDRNNNQKWGSLYDTDRRLYYTDANNMIPANETRIYDDIDGVAGRDDSSIGQAGVGEDPDLEIDSQGGNSTNPSEWEGGNIDLTTRVGNMVIVQENISTGEINQGNMDIAQGADGGGANSAGNNAPDDQGNGGRLVFTFEAALTDYEFIWVDLEDPDAVVVTFRGLLDSNGNDLEDVSFTFADLEDGETYDQDAVWGDRHINSISVGITETTTASLFQDVNRVGKGGTRDAVSFQQVDFDIGGNSGGVGQFAYRLKDAVVVIPEPSAAFSLLVLMSLFIASRKPRARRR